MKNFWKNITIFIQIIYIFLGVIIGAYMWVCYGILAVFLFYAGALVFTVGATLGDK